MVQRVLGASQKVDIPATYHSPFTPLYQLYSLSSPTFFSPTTPPSPTSSPSHPIPQINLHPLVHIFPLVLILPL